MSADDKHSSAEEKSQESPREDDAEKRYSNNAESILEASVADHGKTLLSQTPLPIEPSPPLDETASLKKLDSNVVHVKDDDPFRGLPEHERSILRRQIDVPEVKIGYFSLYRYANKMDLTILLISSICTIAAGAAMPLMTVSAVLYLVWELMLTTLGYFR